MSPTPNSHPQSSKSASSAQSQAKNQANSAPEPSSPAEPMTDQPNSLLATPPTRKLPKDAAPSNAAPDPASTEGAAPQEAPTDEQKDQSAKPVVEDQPVEPIETTAETTVETVEAAKGADTDPSATTGVDAGAATGVDPENAPVPSELPAAASASAQPSEESEHPTNLAAAAAMPEPSAPVTESVAVELPPSAEPISPPPPPRQQPIPPASEPMQYRAIGLVRGKYMPSEEQFTRGFILTEDEVLIDSVLLGRVMSLVKKHIDLEQSHLWVVYPRTRERDLELHMQIVGVWEPEKLNRTASLEEGDETAETIDETLTDADESEFVTDDTEIEAEATSPEAEDALFPSDAASDSASNEDLDDCYFSVRGEVVYQAEEEERLLVKIRRAPKPGETEGKAFKVALKGKLEGKALGYFWDLQVQRQNNELVVTEATQIGMVPPQKRGASGRGRPLRRGAGGPPRRGGPGAGGPPRKRWQGNREESRPVRNGGDRPERSERTSTPSTPRQPISKPVKRRPKDEDS